MIYALSFIEIMSIIDFDIGEIYYVSQKLNSIKWLMNNLTLDERTAEYVLKKTKKF